MKWKIFMPLRNTFKNLKLLDKQLKLNKISSMLNEGVSLYRVMDHNKPEINKITNI